jgi:hypothetical protein
MQREEVCTCWPKSSTTGEADMQNLLEPSVRVYAQCCCVQMGLTVLRLPVFGEGARFERFGLCTQADILVRLLLLSLRYAQGIMKMTRMRANSSAYKAKKKTPRTKCIGA